MLREEWLWLIFYVMLRKNVSAKTSLTLVMILLLNLILLYYYYVYTIFIHMENSEIYTIATLTGHACLAVGDYTAIVPNGPYRKEKLHLALQEAGEIIGDQFDCSTLRREDYEFHMGKDEQSDVLQVTF